jgi:hypothetical protein
MPLPRKKSHPQHLPAIHLLEVSLCLEEILPQEAGHFATGSCCQLIPTQPFSPFLAPLTVVMAEPRLDCPIFGDVWLFMLVEVPDYQITD